MNGKIKFGKKNISDVLITVHLDTSEVFNTLQSDGKGSCSFQLLLHKNYTVRFSKEGYVTKIITVDTKLPKYLDKNYLFAFSAELFEEIPEVNVSVLKKPIAKIAYNPFKKNFDYDYKYSLQINKELKAQYRDYYVKTQKDPIQQKQLSKKIRIPNSF